MHAYVYIYIYAAMLKIKSKIVGKKKELVDLN